MSFYNIRVAKKEDAERIQDLIYPDYFNETIYSGQEYDEEGTKQVIDYWLENACLVAEKEGKIIAVAAMCFYKTFYKTPEAEISMLYVNKENRGTGMARDLVFNLVQHANENKCKVIYTSCASGIDESNDKKYFNLFAKFGFKKLGTELIRI